MPTFSLEEKKIITFFPLGSIFCFEGENFRVNIIGKPICSKGEPKTDVFIGALNAENGVLELKISFKRENADFLENKINAERAEQLFGVKWKKLIIEKTKEIEEKFNNRQLIYKEKSGNTRAGSITLGWKFELLNKPGGYLSGKFELTHKQIIDVYSGSNMSDEKKNAKVDGIVVANSGVANYILSSNHILSSKDVLDNIISIEKYAKKFPSIYFACKALNYRSLQDKWDGDRPLAVYVKWGAHDMQLAPKLIFSEPLLVKGNEVCNILKESMNEIKIKNTSEMNFK